MCAQSSPESRPTMQDVVEMLKETKSPARLPDGNSKEELDLAPVKVPIC